MYGLKKTVIAINQQASVRRLLLLLSSETVRDAIAKNAMGIEVKSRIGGLGVGGHESQLRIEIFQRIGFGRAYFKRILLDAELTAKDNGEFEVWEPRKMQCSEVITENFIRRLALIFAIPEETSTLEKIAMRDQERSKDDLNQLAKTAECITDHAWSATKFRFNTWLRDSSVGPVLDVEAVRVSTVFGYFEIIWSRKSFQVVAAGNFKIAIFNESLDGPAVVHRQQIKSWLQKMQLR